MKYYECAKCQAQYVYGGMTAPYMCGAFVGTVIKEENEIEAGCGGKIYEITKEQADAKVEQLRR